MTTQEAIKILHPDTTVEAIAETEYYAGFKGREAGIKAVEDACVVACEALEKQIPKKPIEVEEREEVDFYYLAFMCPCCNEDVIGQPYRPNNCKHCGQKLDWSE